MVRKVEGFSNVIENSHLIRFMLIPITTLEIKILPWSTVRSAKMTAKIVLHLFY